MPCPESDSCIISEWHEEISEEELDMLAEQHAPTYNTFEESVVAKESYEVDYREGFKSKGL